MSSQRWANNKTGAARGFSFQPLGQYQSAPCKSLRVFALFFSCYVSRGALSVSAVGVVVGARPVSVVVGPLGVRSRRVGSEEVLAWLHMDAVLLGPDVVPFPTARFASIRLPCHHLLTFVFTMDAQTRRLFSD